MVKEIITESLAYIPFLTQLETQESCIQPE